MKTATVLAIVAVGAFCALFAFTASRRL